MDKQYLMERNKPLLSDYLLKTKENQHPHKSDRSQFMDQVASANISLTQSFKYLDSQPKGVSIPTSRRVSMENICNKPYAPPPKPYAVPVQSNLNLHDKLQHLNRQIQKPTTSRTETIVNEALRQLSKSPARIPKIVDLLQDFGKRREEPLLTTDRWKLTVSDTNSYQSIYQELIKCRTKPGKPNFESGQQPQPETPTLKASEPVYYYRNFESRNNEQTFQKDFARTLKSYESESEFDLL